MMIPIAMFLAKTAASAAYPVVMDAFAEKMASMKQSKQQKKLAKLYSYAAAANEAIARVEHLADPSTNEALRLAMQRREATFDRLDSRADQLRARSKSKKAESDG